MHAIHLLTKRRINFSGLFNLSVFFLVFAIGILAYVAAAEAIFCEDCDGTCFGGVRLSFCGTGEVNSCAECGCTETCDKSCGAECTSSIDCPDRCSGNILDFGGTCTSTCTCSYQNQYNCITCADTWRGTACSGADCVWSDCASECTGRKHYTGCSGATCTAPVCTKGVCGAECETSADCPDKCIGNTKYYGGTCASDCTCSYQTGSCAQCSDSECNLNDGWYCTGTDREYRDYHCSGSSCTYTVTSTSSCGPDPYYTCCSWSGGYCYDYPGKRASCHPICSQPSTPPGSQHSNSYCSITGCSVVEDCKANEGWTGGGNIPGCGADPPAEYRSYSCSEPSQGAAACTYAVTQSISCTNDVCLSTCEGNAVRGYKDAYVSLPSGTCAYDLGPIYDNCNTKPAIDTDGGDNPTTAGTCTGNYVCTSSVCSSTSFTDYCGYQIPETQVGIQLNEYYASGSSCLVHAYICLDFERVATKNPLTGTCTPGTAATCSGGAFSTSPGTGGGTDGCTGMCGQGTNSCVYAEYWPSDSGDGCPWPDSCQRTTNDLDISATGNECEKCAGAGRWLNNYGCCGDDRFEFLFFRSCDGYACTTDNNDKACCLAQSGYCVWQGICYPLGSPHPSGNGATCEFVSTGMWRDAKAPSTGISPDGGDYTRSGQTSVGFTLYCSDTGSSGCRSSYYKIVSATQSCTAGGFTTGTNGTVSCPVGQTCDLKVCYYSDDNAGNTEAIKQSNYFLFGSRVCDGRQCGEPCFGTPGICDGPGGSCFSGGCLLNCAVPSPGTGNERIWVTSACGRTGSYKCGPASVCGNSLTSCTVGGSSTPVTGNWASYNYPSGSYGARDTFQISLGGVTKSPAGFAILSECAVTRPGGSVIYFDNWGTDASFSYTFSAGDPEGVWTVDYCGIWSDFSPNGGWSLKQDTTPRQFILDKSPPSITINNPRQNDIYSANFIVNATVTDTYSPINKVFYRWENGSTGPWIEMALNSGYYNANFNVASVSDGTYSIRVRANDSVGNVNEAVVAGVQIDRRPPDIAILSPVPAWYNSDFTVKANVNSNRQIGVVRYRWENSTNTGPWNDMAMGTDGNYAAQFIVRSVSPGSYTIRVWANNSLGNSGSKTIDIGVDYVNPSSQMTRPIAGSFLMGAVFNISWTGSDAHSGVRCHYVTYKYCDNLGNCTGTEYNITFPDGKCTNLTLYEFIPAEQMPSIHDFNNYTFFFRSIALDNAGNLEPKTGWETNATIYIPKLVTFYAVENVTRVLIGNGGKVANNRTVIISVKANEDVPGIMDVTIYYYAHVLGVRPPQNFSGWSNVTCPGFRECNASITIDVSEAEDKKEVDYFIRAANVGVVEFLPPPAPYAYFYYTVYRHPICNFLVGDTLRTILGSSELVAIELRNFQEKFGMVGLEFDSALARFLESGNQYAQIPMSPGEEKIIYARLIPSPPTPPTQEGTLIAAVCNSTADALLQDQDTLTITVGYPANFSELGDFAAMVIVLLACLIYLKLVK